MQQCIKFNVKKGRGHDFTR